MTKVLIVDDDSSFLPIASSLIENMGYECFKASTVSEAINIASDIKPDCYVLDIRLGRDMYGESPPDGVHLFEELKRVHARCRVIFTSAHTDYVEGHLLRRGASKFIDKEVFTDEIESALKEVSYARVLLIEDDIDFAFKAADILSEKGIKCVAVASKVQIETQVGECDFTTFDVVITDVLLDEQRNFHGWDVLGLIPPSFPLDSVFLLTGQSVDEIEKQIGQKFHDLQTRRQLLTAVSRLSEEQILDKEFDTWANTIERVCKKADQLWQANHP